jgi:hypothetical protein
LTLCDEPPPIEEIFWQRVRITAADRDAAAEICMTPTAVFSRLSREDPHFDPKLRAFYYIRVIEIPTPRWTTYDAKFFGTKIPAGAPTSIQDRAYTTPIWYRPD